MSLRVPEAVVVMPYGFRVDPLENGTLGSSLTSISEVAVRAAACWREARSPGASLIVVAESHPELDAAGLPDGSRLTIEAAAEYGVPRTDIVNLSHPEEPTNNTGQQLTRVAEYFSREGLLDAVVDVVHCHYHGRRARYVGRSRGLRPPAFRYISVESILADPEVGDAGIAPELMQDAEHLIAGLKPSERALYWVTRLGLGKCLDAATNRLGPRLHSTDSSARHLLPHFRALLASTQQPDPQAERPVTT